MATTYDKIASTTLGSAAASITFSSIAASWTDIRLVLVAKGDGGLANARLTYNSDNGTNYSRTTLGGNGSTTSSYQNTNNTYIDLGLANLSETIPSMLTYDIFSYAGSTFKTVLLTSSQDYNGSGAVERIVGLWRSTSAITTIKIESTINNYAAGTIATLYGILKA